MCLLSDSSTNLIVRFFNNNYYLKSSGIYSFGIYLLHPGAVDFVRGYSFINTMHLRVVSAIILSYLLGFLFYHGLEKHLIRFANYLCSILSPLVLNFAYKFQASSISPLQLISNYAKRIPYFSKLLN